ncbi:hypothetical protein P7M39_24445, partial [Vibrio parahaemolyticus]|nr:hypothetical protein [Vibrio parahaemolyticus]
MRFNKNTLLMVFADFLIINFTAMLSIFLRFENIADPQFLNYFNIYKSTFLFISISKLLVLYFFGIYRSIWKYASIEEMLKIVAGCIVANVTAIAVLTFLQTSLPRSVYAMMTVFDTALIGGLRFSLRTANERF